MKMESMRLLRNIYSYRSSLCSSSLRFYTTQNAQAQEITTREKIQMSKPTPAKYKRPPFIKNLFLGKFDTELLAFPEILDKDQVAELEANVKIVSNLMKEKVNCTEIDQKRQIPPDFLQDLKELGLFGRLIPAKYGGLDLTHTACIRLNEALSLDWSVCTTLAAHEFFATEILHRHGTEEQKTKYLPQLASGNLIAAFCCTEFESGGEPMSISSTAEQMQDGSYQISGLKTWVTNGEIADIFIVFAKTVHPQDPNNFEITVFLIDRNAEGLEILPQNKICLQGTQSSIVKFKDVSVPASNVIGLQGTGVVMYFETLDTLRFGLNTFTFGTLKALLDVIIDRVIHNERFQRSLGDHQLVRRRISKINNLIYAMESVAYFTAALIDSTENPDVALEKAALKVFNSEGTLYCLKEMQQLVGSSSLMQELQLEQFERDAKGLAVMDGQNDVARLYISLTSLKYFGIKSLEEIVELRNPFYYPMRRLKEMWRSRLLQSNSFTYKQDLGGHVHPSLVNWAQHLEKNVFRLEMAVKKSFMDHGKDIIYTQIDPWKFSEMAINMYAMSAVLSRCSRSYCIGLKNSHHELQMANTFCYNANTKMYWIMNDLMIGIFKNNEANHIEIGGQVIDCKGYFAEHPLKHNY